MVEEGERGCARLFPNSSYERIAVNLDGPQRQHRSLPSFFPNCRRLCPMRFGDKFEHTLTRQINDAILYQSSAQSTDGPYETLPRRGIAVRPAMAQHRMSSSPNLAQRGRKAAIFRA